MAVSLLERRRQFLLNTPHIKTVSGSMASFNTDISANLKECKVYFSPVQEGTGDPSPDNVRPISGWDGITLYLSGSDTSNPTTLTIPFNRTIYGGYVDLVSGEVVEEKYSFVIDGTNYYPAASPRVNNEGFAIAYNGIGYGGFSGLPKGYYRSGNISADILPCTDKVVWNAINFNCIQYGTTEGFLYLRVAIDSSELEDVSSTTAITESMRKWLKDNPVRVLYNLYTPNTYTLTPETIKALKGINNIWSNANGNIEVSYYTH